MTINVYNVPGIDTQHRNVMYRMRERLPGTELFTYETRGRFVPSYTNDFIVEVSLSGGSPLGRGILPNYAIFGYNGQEYGCFVVNVEPLTPNTAALTLHADWWYMFMDADADGGIRRSVYLSGTMVKSTYVRNVNDQPQHYAVPPDITIPVDVSLTSVFSNSYRIVSTFQCYKNNTWPQADGKAFQVTAISRDTVSAEDLMRGTGEIVAAFRTMQTLQVYEDDTSTTYTIISISRMQFVPDDIITTNTASDNRGYIYGFVGNTGVRAYVQLLLGLSAGSTATASTNVQITWADVDGNNAASRTFIGNRHLLIPLPDIRQVNMTTRVPAFRVSGITTMSDGFVCSILTDQATDISHLFDASFVYNSDSEAAFLSGDSRTLSAVSAGVSGGAQIIGGVAAVATGNPAGVLPIISGGITVAGAVNGAQYRSRQVVATGNSASISALDSGIVCAVHITPANQVARRNDALLQGYNCQSATASTTVGVMLGSSRYEYYRFADDLIMWAANPDGKPTPPSSVLEDIRGAFMRGVGIWGDGLNPGDVLGLVQLRGSTA